MPDSDDRLNAPVGARPCLTESRPPACPSTAPAGATSSISRFFVLHARYDAATGELIEFRDTEVTDLDIAEWAGLDRDRLGRLPIAQRGLVYEQIHDGLDATTALRHAEQGTGVN